MITFYLTRLLEMLGVKARNPDPNCLKTKDGDSLSMHYTGSLWSTGAVFDSSVSRGPFDFVLGQGQVIKGKLVTYPV